jgi:hypothetical protein
MNTGILKFVLLGAMIFISTVAKGDLITLYTPTAGDATYAWNSKYGPTGYSVGDMGIGIYLSMGGTWGNDHTVAIFEVPIAPLAGQTLLSATLNVNSTGFGTGYYYGSAQLGWLDVGSLTLTGDVVADNLGGPSGSLPNNWEIYNSDLGNGAAGVKSFDVASYVQADLAAGRSYCTFVLSGSRETSGTILSAENGITGPRIEAVTVPEPASIVMLLLGGLLITAFRNMRKAGKLVA